MLVGDDRFSLPEGVTLGDGVLSDAVRGASWPVNPGGVYVLGRAGDPLAAIARGLAATYRIDAERAAADVASFVAGLNSLLLLNVTTPRRWRSWLALAVRLAPLRTLPAPRARRVPLGRRRLRTTAAALAPHALLLGLAVAAPLLAVGLLAAVPAAALGSAAGGGLVLHEAAHVVALRRRPSALVLCGWTVFVLHAPLRGARRALVALSGPLAASAAGVLLVAAAAAADAPTAALAGALLTTHALGATVAARDGRAACGL